MRSAAWTDWVGRARRVPIEDVVANRGIVLKGRGVSPKGPCPACGGHDRFTIHKRKQYFHCRGCGHKGDVIALVEFLDGVDFTHAVETLTGEPPPKPNGRYRSKGNPASKEAKRISVAEFQYHGRDGNLALVVTRYEFKNADGSYVLDEHGKREKKFLQKRPDPEHAGKWIWNADTVGPLLYKLPDVLKAVDAGRPILIVEGEAKADLLWSWDVPATCIVGGSGGIASKWSAAHSEFLRGAHVVLNPDADNPGWSYVNAIGAALQGIAASVRVLRLPDLPQRGDIVDWAAAGHTADELRALLVAPPPEWQAPAESLADDPDKARAKAREDELLEALAKTSGLDYERQRKTAAKALGVSPRAIDNEVRTRREDAGAAPLYGHWIVEPWPDPADGDSLLRDIIKRIKRHVIISDDGALTIALWIMLSWVHDEIATYSPILNINSAEPECGKSTTMGLLSFLMPRCIASVEATEAAIYRAIKRWAPSFCLDEFDSIMVDDNKAALRSVINSGHMRGQGVLRCIGDDKVPELFSTFAPKVLGMVGRKLPGATLSRCIFVELRRRKKDERVDKFKHVDDNELADLRRRLCRWALDNQDTLREAQPAIPESLLNRRDDNWKIQFAIADLSGGDWGDKARAAAVKIETGSDNRTASARVLAAIKAVFDTISSDLFEKDPAISSEDLIQHLTADPASEWTEWGKASKPITQRQLARLLKPYGIAPEPVRIKGRQGLRQVRGYLRERFTEAWERYL
jgi:hypothetical protein